MHAEHDDVGLGGLFGGHGLDVGTELFDEWGEALRAAAVGNHGFHALGGQRLGEGRAQRAGADDTDGHGLLLGSALAAGFRMAMTTTSGGASCATGVCRGAKYTGRFEQRRVADRAVLKRGRKPT